MKQITISHADVLVEADAGRERNPVSRGDQGESTVVFLVTGAIFGVITLFGWLDGLHAVKTWLGL